jgi:uncharacterized membrane protein YfcA
MNAELVVIGLIIGTFIGISGVGGGSIMTPVLILVLGINPLVAVGTDLLYSVPTKILGAVMHARQQTIDWRIVRALLIGGIPGVILGLVLVLVLRHAMDLAALTVIVKRMVAVALFISAFSLMYSLIIRRAIVPVEETADLLDRRRTLLMTAGGALIGLFVALTSIGSGAMTLPMLFLLVPFVGIRKLVGTDIVFAAFLIPLAAAGHWSVGDVNLPVAFSLLAGSLPGVYIGSKLCKVLPEVWLRPALATVLVIAGTRLW